MELAENVQGMHRQVVHRVGGLLDEMAEAFADHAELVAWLEQMRATSWTTSPAFNLCKGVPTAGFQFLERRMP